MIPFSCVLLSRINTVDESFLCFKQRVRSAIRKGAKPVLK